MEAGQDDESVFHWPKHKPSSAIEEYSFDPERLLKPPSTPTTSAKTLGANASTFIASALARPAQANPSTINIPQPHQTFKQLSQDLVHLELARFKLDPDATPSSLLTRLSQHAMVELNPNNNPPISSGPSQNVTLPQSYSDRASQQDETASNPPIAALEPVEDPEEAESESDIVPNDELFRAMYPLLTPSPPIPPAALPAVTGSPSIPAPTTAPVNPFGSIMFQPTAQQAGMAFNEPLEDWWVTNVTNEELAWQTVENQERDFNNILAEGDSDGLYRLIDGQAVDTPTPSGSVAPPPDLRATHPAVPPGIPQPRPDPLGAPFTPFPVGHILGTFTHPPGPPVPPRPETRTTTSPFEWPSLEPRIHAALQPSIGDINSPPTFTSRRRTHKDAFGDDLDPELNSRPRGPQRTPANTATDTAGPIDNSEPMPVAPPASDESNGDAPSATQERSGSAVNTPATNTDSQAIETSATAPFNPNQPTDTLSDDDEDRPATDTAAAAEDQLMAEEEQRQQQQQQQQQEGEQTDEEKQEEQEQGQEEYEQEQEQEQQVEQEQEQEDMYGAGASD